MRVATYAALCFLVVGTPRPDDAKALQGQWWGSSLVIDGEKVKGSVASPIRLTLDGKEYRERARGDDLATYRYALLPGGVIRFDVPGEEGVTFYGRYELKGDRLRVCYPGPIDGERGALPPAALESPEGPKGHACGVGTGEGVARIRPRIYRSLDRKLWAR